MRIFPDTNVLVSAFTARGLCAELYELAALNHQLVIGEPVVEELIRILAGKPGVPADKLARLRRELGEFERAPPSSVPIRLPVRDAADSTILACAIAARVDVLVTGDKELLDLRRAEEVPIVSPRELWRTLVGQDGEG